MDKRYIQLYSINQELAKDFVGSLKRVAEVGYTGVEFAGGNYGNLSVTEMKKVLADLNLEPLSTHIRSEAVPAQLDYAAELGVKYLIDPMASMETYDDAAAFAEVLNKTGKLCKDRGIVFGYHNHRHEFLECKDGTLMDTLILNTDPDLVSFQLDVGWATCAGCDVPAFIAKYAGRFCMIHVKECAKVVGPEKMPDFSKFPRDENGRPQIPAEIREQLLAQRTWNVPSGKGIIDWPVVVKAALAQGAQAFVVEREYDYADDIFKCIEEDCNYLKTL